MLAARLRGLAEVAEALDVIDVDTVRAAIDRPFDPLPARWLFGWQVDSDRLELWRRREANDPSLPLLVGWRSVCGLLRLGRHAVARLIRRSWHPLPVFVAPDGSWSAYESALQDWISAEVEPGWRRARGASADPARKDKPAARAKLKRAA